MTTYSTQRDVFKIATGHGWPEKEPSVLGCWEADRKFWSACRYITEHDHAWNAVPAEHQEWVRRIGGRAEP